MRRMTGSWYGSAWRRGIAITFLALVTLAIAVGPVVASDSAALPRNAPGTPVHGAVTNPCTSGYLEVTPCFLATTSGWGRTDTAVIHVRNRSTSAQSIAFAVICSTSGPVLQSCGGTPLSSITLDPDESDSLIVTYTLRTANVLSPPSVTRADLLFRITRQQLVCTPTCSWPYLTEIEGGLRVRATYHLAELEPSLDERAPERCIAQCFEARYAQSFVGSRSLNVARGVTLVYGGATVVPRPFLHATVTGLGGSRSTGVLRLTAEINGVRIPFVNGSQTLYFTGVPAPPLTTSPDPQIRIGGQLDVSSYPTGIYPLRVLVRNMSAASETFALFGADDTLNTFLPVVNWSDSPVAHGWGIAGVQRLYAYASANTDTVAYLIVNGDGSYARFERWRDETLAWQAAGVSDGSVLETTLPVGGVPTSVRRRYPDGTVVDYNTAGYMTRLIDGVTKDTTVYEYESWSGGQRLKRILDPYRKIGGLPAATVLAYGTNGLASVTEPGTGGRVTTVTVNASRELTQITDPDTRNTSFAYDAQHRLLTVTDRRNGITRFAYNATTGLLDAVTAPAAPKDLGGGATQLDSARTQYVPWQPAGVPYVATTSTTPFTSADTLRRAQVISAKADTTRYEVDRWGQPTKVTDPVAQVTTSGRDRGLYFFRQPRAGVTTANDTVWAKRVPSPMLTWLQAPGAEREEYEYRRELAIYVYDAGRFSSWPWVNLVRSKRAGASSVYFKRSSTVVVDSLWGLGVAPTRYFGGSVRPDSVRVTTVEAPAFQLWGSTTEVDTVYQVTRYTYHAPTHRVARVIGPTNDTTTYVYDAVSGNLAQTVQPGNRATTTIFDSHGRDSVLQAPLTANVVLGYDAVDRVTSRTALTSPAVVTTYEYDGLYQTAVVDGKGQRYATDRDALGRPTREYAANSTTSYRAYRYDLLGQLTGLTNRRGQAVQFVYDRLGRLTQRTTVGAVTDTVADTLAYFWGFVGSTQVPVVMARNGITRDTIWSDPAQEARLGSRAITRFATAWTTGIQVARSSRSIWSGADSITVTGAPGSYAPVIYSKLPYVRGAVSITIRGAADTTLVQFTDRKQRRTWNAWTVGASSWTLPVGQERRLPQTTGNQPAEVGYWGANLDTVFRRAYGYDSAYRVLTMQEPSGGQHRRFLYDSLGRLKGVEYRTQLEGAGCQVWPTSITDPLHNPHSGWSRLCTAPDSARTFTYDAAGNRTDQTNLYDPGNRQRQFGTLTFQYDLDGNVTQKTNAATGQTWTYTWDALNRLRSVQLTGGSVVRYEYDGWGRLVRRKTAGAVDRHWLYVGKHILAELDGSLQKRVHYVYDQGLDRPVAALGGTGITGGYHLLDELGNVAGQRTSASSNAAVVQQVRYDVWGKPTVTGASGNKLLWKGLLGEDGSGGLYYMRNRWYDPDVGRFLSEDPKGLEGGINLYQFASGDPINFSDPFGLDPVPKCVQNALEDYFSNTLLDKLDLRKMPGALRWLLRGALGSTGGRTILLEKSVFKDLYSDRPSTFAVALLAHEVLHTIQQANWGDGFLPEYLKDSAWKLLTGRNGYTQNKFEEPAIGRQLEIQDQLESRFGKYIDCQ